MGDTDKKKKKEDEVPTIQTGTYVFPNSDRYEGEYLQTNGGLERSGHGVHTTSEGMVYTGAWTGDKMNGHGCLTHINGSLYEGEFVNNQFHGTGKYTWPNGSFYQGQFVENRMEGEGEFTDTEGQVWTGQFRYKAAPGLRFKLSLAC